MAEIAGLVLAAVPIAIWALEKYAEPYEEFHNYRTSIETFRADLILQNRQLTITLSNAGLGVKPSMEELRECFETKFPEISRELLVIIQRMDEVAAGLLRNLQVDTTRNPEGFPDKIHWEWRRVKHGFGTKKRNKVIADLRKWNEDLRRSLEKPEIPVGDDTRKVQELKRCFNIQRFNSIRLCLHSLHRALDTAFSCCACSNPHQAAVDLDWRTLESGQTTSLGLAVSYDHGATLQQLPPSCSWRRLRAASAPKVTIDSAPQQVLPLLPPRVRKGPAVVIRPPRLKIVGKKLVRSLSRTPSPPPTPLVIVTSAPQTPSQLPAVTPTSGQSEISSLCASLCTDCNPWTLSGLIGDPDEEQGGAFSLDHDKDRHTIIKTIPLKSLLTSQRCQQPSQQGQGRQRNPYLSLLSAKQRYGIAAAVAWSVLHLSGSPWLGDKWDEHQARILLEKSLGGREVLSRFPCASYVFAPMVGPSRGPETTANDFRDLVPNRAVFALGVLLVELSIEKTLAELREGLVNCSNMPISTSTPTAAAPTIFDDYRTALGQLEEVRRLSGDCYGYAAERCIKFSFEGRDIYKDFDFSQFRQQFYEVVVAPVQATYLMFPDSSASSY